jgi:hypothetical protein
VPGRRLHAIALICLLVAAAAVRYRALFTDFWLDEIFSYDGLARQAHSAADIFLNPSLKHDNNHHLNTLWLYVFRSHHGWVLLRMPSFVAGVLIVALVHVIASRRSALDGWLAGLLSAFSFMLVIYSTEARGYALLLAFALLAYLALHSYLKRPAAGSAALFFVWIVLALAAHPTVIHFYAGALLWSGYRLRQQRRQLVSLHAAPAIWFLLWGALVLRGSTIGGGDPRPWQRTADEALAWTFGYPLSTIPPIVAVSAAAGLVILDAWLLWREGSDEGLFFTGAILGPVVFVAALSPPYLFARYFLVSLLLLLLVAARHLARLWRMRTWGPPVAAAVLAASAVGNLVDIVPFSRYGRGEASRAVADLEREAGRPGITVSSLSLDRWNTLPIEFYERELGLSHRIQYVPRDQFGTSAPVDWVIDQTQDPDHVIPRKIEPWPGKRYALAHVYSAFGPSGFTWILYRQDRGERPPDGSPSDSQ